MASSPPPDVEQQPPPPLPSHHQQQQQQQQQQNAKDNNDDDDVVMISKSDLTRTSDKEEEEEGDGNDDAIEENAENNSKEDEEAQQPSSLHQEQLQSKRRRRNNKICCCCVCCILIIVVVLAALYVSARNNNTQSIVPFEEYLDILDSHQINPESSLKEIELAMKEMINRYDNEDIKCQKSESIFGITTTTKRNLNDNKTVRQERKYVSSSSSSVNEDTLFEIGSISKPITGLVLAYQIELGYIESLDVPINDFLPDDIPLLEVDSNNNNNPVAFRHLVTHTSGLPRLSDIMMKTRTDNREVNPYAGYTEQDLLEQITIAANNGLSQTGEIEYSNFGFSVLGYLLGETNNNIPDDHHHQSSLSSFPEIQQNLTQTLLNMTNTYIGNTIPSEIATTAKLLKGYNRRYPDDVMPYWYDGGIFIDGAGSTISSASDLLTLAETLMMYYDNNNDENNININTNATTEPQHHPLLLKNAIRRSLQPLKEIDEGITTETTTIKSGIAYSWVYEKHITSTTSSAADDGGDDGNNDEKIFYGHSGGTQGFTSNLVFNPKEQLAIVALTNCGSTADIGLMSGALIRRLSDLDE